MDNNKNSKEQEELVLKKIEEQEELVLKKIEELKDDDLFYETLNVPLKDQEKEQLVEEAQDMEQEVAAPLKKLAAKPKIGLSNQMLYDVGQFLSSKELSTQIFPLNKHISNKRENIQHQLKHRQDYPFLGIKLEVSPRKLIKIAVSNYFNRLDKEKPKKQKQVVKDQGADQNSNETAAVHQRLTDVYNAIFKQCRDADTREQLAQEVRNKSKTAQEAMTKMINKEFDSEVEQKYYKELVSAVQSYTPQMLTNSSFFKRNVVYKEVYIKSKELQEVLNSEGGHDRIKKAIEYLPKLIPDKDQADYIIHNLQLSQDLQQEVQGSCGAKEDIASGLTYGLNSMMAYNPPKRGTGTPRQSGGPLPILYEPQEMYRSVAIANLRSQNISEAIAFIDTLPIVPGDTRRGLYEMLLPILMTPEIKGCLDMLRTLESVPHNGTLSK